MSTQLAQPLAQLAQHYEASLHPTNSLQPTPELSDVVLQAIVACGGNTKLAAERLHREGHYDHLPTSSELATVLHGRLSELKEKMELVATLELFSLMPQLHKTLVESLSTLEGSDSVRAYMDLMGLIQKATSKNELTVNVHEEVWHRAPVDLKKYFAQLEAAGQLDQIDRAVERLRLVEPSTPEPTHMGTGYASPAQPADSVIDHEPG